MKHQHQNIETMNYFEELKKRTKIDIKGTTIDDENVIVKFNLDGHAGFAEVGYRVGRNEMIVYLYENTGGCSTETFDYGQPLKKDDVFEAVQFGYNFLKENI